MLRVEEGQGCDRPNSYCSLECADEYCIERGLWPKTPKKVPVSADNVSDAQNAGKNTNEPQEAPDALMVANKEAALIRAFDYLNTLHWLGSPHDWQQLSAWPRTGVPVPDDTEKTIPEDCVPRQVVQAQIELAAQIYLGCNPLAPLERGGKVRSKTDSNTVSVDVISKSESHSVTYIDSAPVEMYFPSVAPLIASLLEVVPGKGMGPFREAGRG